MKITVRDCLELSVFKDAQVVAGTAGLNNDVRSVSVLEATVPNEIKAYADDNGGMLLTGFFAVRDDAVKQCQIVKQVAADGHAALVVFYVGAVVQKLDKSVIEAAETAGLPLIVMSKDSKVNYSQMINQIMEKVLYSDNFSNRLISNTIFHLLNFEKHSNFQAAVREAAINNDFQIVLLSEDFNPIFSVETRQKTTIAEAIRMGHERSIEKQSELYTLIDVNGVLTYWGPVMINNDK